MLVDDYPDQDYADNGVCLELGSRVCTPRGRAVCVCVHCTPRGRGGRAGGTVCVHVCLSGVWAAVCVHPEVEVVELVELTNEQTPPSFDEG